jgi:hypothetical protein
MDAISLPLVHNSDTVHLALARMKAYARGGVVVEDGDFYRLVHAGELLAARAACVEILASVKEGEPVRLVSSLDAQVHGMDLVRPLRTQPQYQSMFGSIPDQYALVAADRDVAMIVTSSEKKTYELESPGGYECGGTPRHYFPRPRVQVGQSCPKCLVVPSTIVASP